MTETEYQIIFPKQGINFNDNQLTFLINHIKSRVLSTLYFKLKLYDMEDNLIYTYTSDRWVIDTEYNSRSKTFSINEKKLALASQYSIELYAVGITSANPLYFNELMLAEGEVSEYHKPSDIQEDVPVEFNKSSYVNLYNFDGSYLQVIRPKRDGITTSKLTGSSCTVLAPHFEDEDIRDDPVDIFLEFINQTEQRIDVLR